jgi:hypothetical protein
VSRLIGAGQPMTLVRQPITCADLLITAQVSLLRTPHASTRLRRFYLRCPRCDQGRYPLDELLRLEGFVSPQAMRLLTLAGASWSFAGTAVHLAEFGGLCPFDQTIRQVCHRETGLMADRLNSDEDAGTGFATASGDIEFQTAGTTVNTGRAGTSCARAASPKGSAANRTATLCCTFHGDTWTASGAAASTDYQIGRTHPLIMPRPLFCL